MRRFPGWARRHPLIVDSAIAVAAFALGLRFSYDVGTDFPDNFRFANGVWVMALLTLPLAVRRR